jgi:hypothetical protein
MATSGSTTVRTPCPKAAPLGDHFRSPSAPVLAARAGMPRWPS